MAQLDGEEDEDEDKVTLLDFKDNLDLHSTRMLKKLACILIDSNYESDTEKDLLNNSVDVSQDEKMVLTTQVPDLEVRIATFETEKRELLNLMEAENKSDVKLKRKISENEYVLTERLKKVELKLNLALERNSIIAKDL